MSKSISPKTENTTVRKKFLHSSTTSEIWNFFMQKPNDIGSIFNLLWRGQLSEGTEECAWSRSNEITWVKFAGNEMPESLLTTFSENQNCVSKNPVMIQRKFIFARTVCLKLNQRDWVYQASLAVFGKPVSGFQTWVCWVFCFQNAAVHGHWIAVNWMMN